MVFNQGALESAKSINENNQTDNTRLLHNYNFKKTKLSKPGKEDVAPLKTKQACLVNHGSEARLTLNTIGESCTTKDNDSFAVGRCT